MILELAKNHRKIGRGIEQQPRHPAGVDFKGSTLVVDRRMRLPPMLYLNFIKAGGIKLKSLTQTPEISGDRGFSSGLSNIKSL